jgi:hypothetical protein
LSRPEGIERSLDGTCGGAPFTVPVTPACAPTRTEPVEHCRKLTEFCREQKFTAEEAFYNKSADILGGKHTR